MLGSAQDYDDNWGCNAKSSVRYSRLLLINTGAHVDKKIGGADLQIKEINTFV